MLKTLEEVRAEFEKLSDDKVTLKAAATEDAAVITIVGVWPGCRTDDLRIRLPIEAVYCANFKAQVEKTRAFRTADQGRG